MLIDKQLADLQLPAGAALDFLAQATIMDKVNLLEFTYPYWRACCKAWQLFIQDLIIFKYQHFS